MDFQEHRGAVSAALWWVQSIPREQLPALGRALCPSWLSSPGVSHNAISRVIQRVTKDTRISFLQALWFQVKQPLTNEKA